MPPAHGAAAALAKKREAGKAKISKTAVKQSDPVLVKRKQLQQEHDRLLSLMARLPAQGSACSSMAADESFTTSDAPHVTQVITIRQPFASGIMAGKKQVENRSWGVKLPKDGSGTWLAVHTGNNYCTGTAFQPSIAELQRVWPQMPPADVLPRGAIIGFMHVKVPALPAAVASLVGSSPAAHATGTAAPRVPLCRLAHAPTSGPLAQTVVPIEDVRDDPQACGPLCWLIDRVLPFEQPAAHVKGAQSLWHTPGGLLYGSYVRQGKIVTLPPNSMAQAWPGVYAAGRTNGDAGDRDVDSG